MARRNPRLIVRPEIESPAIRPTASPVDSFVRPESPKSAQAAQALRELAPGLMRLAGDVRQEEQEQAREAGSTAAREADLKGITPKQASDLVAKGEIDRADNPYFLAGYRRQMGILSAYKAYAEFQKKLADDPRAATGDLGAFDTIYREFLPQYIDQNVGGRDAAFESGFQEFDRLLLGERNEYVNRTQRAVKAAADEQRYQIAFQTTARTDLPEEEVVSLLQVELANVHTTDRLALPKAVESYAQALMDQAVTSGGGMRAVGRAQRILEGIKTNGVPLTARAEVQDIIKKEASKAGAFAELRRKTNSRATQAEIDLTKDRWLDRLSEVESSYKAGEAELPDFAALYKDSIEIPDGELRQAVVDDIDKLRKDLLSPEASEDSPFEKGLRLRIDDVQNATTLTELRKAYDQGLVTRAVFKDLRDDILQRDRETGDSDAFKKKVEGSMGWTWYKQVENVLRDQASSKQKSAQLRQLEAGVLQNFRLMYSLWMRQNPDVSFEEQYTKGQQIYQQVLEAVKVDPIAKRYYGDTGTPGSSDKANPSPTPKQSTDNSGLKKEATEFQKAVAEWQEGTSPDIPMPSDSLLKAMIEAGITLDTLRTDPMGALISYQSSEPAK